MARFEVVPLGDSALLVRSLHASGPHADKTAGLFVDARERIVSARIPGVKEVVIGYASLAVFLDPAVVWPLPAAVDQVSESMSAQAALERVS